MMRWRVLWTCILFLASPLTLAQDAQDWWFDVEVIVFDRGLSLAEVAEQFEHRQQFTPPDATLDLLTRARQPDVSWIYQSLAACTEIKQVWLPPVMPEDWPVLPELHAEPAVDKLPGALPAVVPGMENQPLTQELVPGSPSLAQETPLPIVDKTELWLEFAAPEINDEGLIDRLIETPYLGCFEFSTDYNPVIYAEPDVLPVVPVGASKDDTWGPHLLSSEDFELTDVSLRIRSERGLTRLLHTAWRQPVAFGRENAATVRIYGGQNFAGQFNPQGLQLVEREQAETEVVSSTPLDAFNLALSGLSVPELSTPEAFSERLGSALEPTFDNVDSTENSLDAIWQVDGTIKVFLQYINRVPYLHIDGDIAYRQPIPIEDLNPVTQRLTSIPYKQLRRVISTQLHYFDHPMFGMLIEIRRYKKP